MNLTAIELKLKAPQALIGLTEHYLKGVYQYSYDSDGNCWYIQSNKPIVQLLRQDQLQKIISEYISEKLGHNLPEIKQAFLSFAHWLHEQYLNEPYTCVPTNCFETGEQLWLAFVMEELYNKKWDSDNFEWIKIEDGV